MSEKEMITASQSDKTREHNERVEKGIITDMLNGNIDKYLDAKITPEHFGKFRKEASYIIGFYNAYNGKPTQETFKGMFPAFELPTEIDPTAMLITHIRRKYIKQQLYPMINELGNNAEKGDTDEVHKFIEKFYKIQGVSNSKVIDVLKDVDIRFRHYQELRANPETFIPYPFPEWDRMLGGMGRADLIVIAGRPGEGKSLVAIRGAYVAYLAGYNVAYFNGEMDEDEVGYRVDTMVTGVSNYGIAHGKDFVSEKYEATVNKIKVMAAEKGNKFLLLGKGDMDEKITPKFLEKFCKQNDIDALFVDQFSLVDTTSKMKQDSEISYELVREIKMMQKSLKIPVVLLAQIKRQDKKQQSERKEGMPKYDLSDMGKTRALEEFASVVVLLDNQYERDAQGRAVINMFFGKSRGSKARGNVLTYAWDIDKGDVQFLKSTLPLDPVPQTPKTPPPVQGTIGELSNNMRHVEMIPVEDDDLPF